MIINFSIQNFGSIKEKQTLSFEADRSLHLEEHYVINIGGLRLLKLALIYGKNASGKTTVLKALDFLRKLALEPKSKKADILDFEPFLFDSRTPQENSVLGIDFLYKKNRYSYAVEFNKKAIVSERLYYYKPKKSQIFKRTTNLDEQYTEISFGKKLNIDKAITNALKTSTLWNDTVLAGSLKTNIKMQELKEVTDWFQFYLNPLIHTKTGLERFVTKRLEESQIAKQDLINILKQADFNISDILIKKEEIAASNQLIEILEKVVERPKEEVDKLKETGTFTKTNIEFEHTVNNVAYYLPLASESQGTKRYFEFAGLLALLISKTTLFSIDELESSLHPELTAHLLLSFITNAGNSQLIATTHDREILGDRSVFRNDSIWITDKTDECSTELYSIADFDTSVIRDTTNILNAYKAGKLKGVPNVTDHYINIGE